MARFVKVGVTVFDLERVVGYRHSFASDDTYLAVYLDTGQTIEFTSIVPNPQESRSRPAERAAIAEGIKILEAHLSPEGPSPESPSGTP